MNSVNLNTVVINSIKELLPPGTNLFNFLSDILPINKEAIYRRIRGEVVFTFFELYSIAQKLVVSMDYLVKSLYNNNCTFELVLQHFEGAKEVSDLPNKFALIVERVLADSSSRFELSHNLFPQLPAHMFYYLSRYNSFKWIYKNRIGEAKRFKEIDYPQEIFEMHKDGNIATMEIENTSYIWDYTIIEMMVREIKYFETISLIEKEDIALLKKDLFEFLYFVEELTIKGVFPTGNKVDIYISPVNSDAAYSYIESTHFKVCIVGVYDFEYIISTDNLAFEMTKRKIQSLKNGAILISGASELDRFSFFRKQYELLDTL